jgi:hypothetical protein
MSSFSFLKKFLSVARNDAKPTVAYRMVAEVNLLLLLCLKEDLALSWMMVGGGTQFSLGYYAWLSQLSLHGVWVR